MQICPNCGYSNDDKAETCLRCDYPLAEPADEAQGTPGPATPGRNRVAAPIPLPRTASTTRRQKVLWFVLGAVLGLIPVAIFAVGAFAGELYNGYYLQPGWPFLGCLLFPVILIIMSIFLRQKKLRSFGYGLLAGAIISPIVVSISCSIPQKV